MFSVLWTALIMSTIVMIEASKRGGAYNLSSIEGWFGACGPVQAFLRIQQTTLPDGLQGVAEIGIHHGKSFICMLDAIPIGVPIVALDLFEGLGEFNYDHSGSGSEVAFTKNLKSFYAKYPEKIKQVVIKAADSTKLVAADIFLLTRDKPINFFSVDGCHTANCTLSDMRLAHSVLGDKGVIMVDDYFNPAWPGVSLAVGVFLEQEKTKLSGFMYGGNKFYIVKRQDREFWHDQFVAYFKSIKQFTKVHPNSGLGGDSLIQL